MTVNRRQLLSQGFSALRSGDLQAAKKISESMLERYQDDPEVFYLASEVMLQLDEPSPALEYLQAAVKLVPSDADLLLKLARLQLAQRRRSDVRETLKKIATLDSKQASVFAGVAGCHARLDNYPLAADYYERALQIMPDTALRFELATALFFTGEFDRAQSQLGQMLKSSPHAGHALYLRSSLRRQTLAENNIEDIKTRLDQMQDPLAKANALYALAKELEDIGDFKSSFVALAEGAKLKRSTLRYNLDEELATISGICEKFDASQFKEAVGNEQAGAIFIVGMPRTGTTLVEHMLTRHSSVRSAGELLDFGHALAAAARAVRKAQPELSMLQAAQKIDFAELGKEYMRGVRELVPEGEVFVDKMPINFMYCGLIKKALPNARIIHLVRDPMDSCYAIFKTMFGQAYHFSYDQSELAGYFAAYEKTMRHWHAVLPDSILDVSYEALVSDTANQAKRLLDYCQLPWMDAVLSPDENQRSVATASAAQVREPVHARSIGRWRNLADELAPMRARLQAENVVSAS